MNTRLQSNTEDASTLATQLLVIFALIEDAAENQELPQLLSPAPSVLNVAEPSLLNGEFKAANGETLLLHRPAGFAAERLLLIGLGKRSSLNASQLRQAAGIAVRTAMAKELKSLAILLPATDKLPVSAPRAIAEGAILASIDLDVYKTDRKDRTPAECVLFASGSAEAQQQVDEGIARAEAQNFARILVNEPGNILTPTELGRRTAEMAARVGLHCEVHSTDKLRELNMGAFLGVAQGSEQPPALIVLRYEPPVAPPAGAPLLALVGKGITFDTGGISIKPADGMEKMKNDMGGAAAMIGAMQAIAALKPAVRVMAVICSAENMPDGKAYRPGDVLTAMSGKTIEVMNTDAEGRLVLADGLHYATTLGATHLIDAATLTGACVVALGRLNAGLFANDEATCDRFLTAMRAAGEGFWRLPCGDEYRDLIKSQIADIQNTGVDRYGGAITAAMFLKEFVGNTPWIHLDIAGQAVIDDARTYIAKGASGFGTRSIVEWVCSFASKG